MISKLTLLLVAQRTHIKLLSLFACTVLAIPTAVSASETNGVTTPVSENNMIGLYDGHVWLPTRLESITLSLRKDGQLSFVSHRESNERESTGLGVWKLTANDAIAFYFIAYRYGTELCTGYAPNAVPESCKMIVSGEAELNTAGKLTGIVSIKGTERSSGYQDIALPPLEFSFDKVTLD